MDFARCQSQHTFTAVTETVHRSNSGRAHTYKDLTFRARSTRFWVSPPLHQKG